MPTIKEMCETIVKADFLRNQDGSSPTAEQIFNSSPSGELFQVFEWYEDAKQILESKDMSGPARAEA